MRAICIQPPFVQLNAPYPAAWYLDAWLRSRGHDSRAEDHSIALAREVFSRRGLERVFAAARQALASRRAPDRETARRVEAYLDQEGRYLAMADGVLGFLSGEDPAFAYRLAVGAGLPMGMRTEAVLGDEGGIAPQDAGALATAVINDLSDFISYALDPGFGAVRYAERIAHGAEDFGPILEASRSGWVFREFYRPMLREAFGRLAADGGRILVCLTVPFPGCLAGAVAAAEEARAAFGQDAVILLGGGYVSTELRFLKDPAIFSAVDYLCYDAGYGSLESILARLSGDADTPLYRTRHLDPDGIVAASGFPPDEPRQAAPADPGRPEDPPPLARFRPCPPEEAARLEAAERRAIAGIHPDYLGAPLAGYLRIVDSPNPMHRLWNDTPWLKYRLSYGCYWKRCAFCDTELDYIKRHLPTDLDALMEAADRAAAGSGLHGIHFTDEAMPPRLVKAFGGLNARRNRPFTFWGNARFDRSWTEETCARAAEGGLVAVSGGIEIATGRGLEIVDKGFSLQDLLRSLAAFKKSGILVHAYLIYGFPGQSDQEIADSAEMVRVLLSEGLVDSAFWHKFVLTRHSRMHALWERGGMPALEPRGGGSRFSVNDLSFAGEDASERWTVPLDAALAAWSDRGELETPLSRFLPKGLPGPRLDGARILREAGV